MKLKTEITVRYAETDQMGIAHHSVYPIWYEVGRTEFANQIGMNYSNIEKQGILMPLVEVHCKFYMPAHYEDVLIIETEVSKLTPARIIFEYNVINKKTGDLLSTGSTMHGWVGKDLKPLNLKKHFPEIYEKFNSCIDE